MARPEYLEITCKSAINRVQGMPYLKWSLNPYGGCVHKCRFCFAVQYRVIADRGSQQDFGTRLFIKTNLLHVLAQELRRPSLQGEHITLGTANPFHRLRAMRTLREAGVTAGVFMAPVLPGLTDSAASIEAVAAAARDHKAAYFSANAL